MSIHSKIVCHAYHPKIRTNVIEKNGLDIEIAHDFFHYKMNNAFLSASFAYVKSITCIFAEVYIYIT